MSRKPPKGKSLAEVNPELAKQWHPTKNGELTPFDFTFGSGKKVWWKCPKGDDHEWESSIDSRSNGGGCSVCRGFKVVKSNCLAIVNPEVAKQWHPTKNGEVLPSDVYFGTSKKFWWKCPKGVDHEWITSVEKRKYGRGCPVCRGLTVVTSNCLAIVNPEVAKQWHPTKNGELTPFDFTVGSAKKVWWKCPKGEDHEWESSIVNICKGNGCPVCNGNKVVESNSLGTTHPHLVSEWHPIKNGRVTIYQISKGQTKKYWWKCFEGIDHEWEASPNNRSRGRGCSVCRGLTVVTSNCLATVYPELAKQWHPTKNGELTPFDFTVGSAKKVWWKCPKGEDHEWKTAISHRTHNENDTNCPYCTLTPQSKQELIITFELTRFFKINPKGYKSIIQGKLWSIDIYIPEINLGIEFDGGHWHKEKRDLDKQKTIQLTDAGFNIIRIREEPLKRIFDTDIISKKPYNGKGITDNLLKQIMTTYKLDKRTITKIEKYLLKDELQNEKALDKYIDQILTEKAEKKSKD